MVTFLLENSEGILSVENIVTGGVVRMSAGVGWSSTVHLVEVENPAGMVCCRVKQPCTGLLSLIGCTDPTRFTIYCGNNGLLCICIPVFHCMLFY